MWVRAVTRLAPPGGRPPLATSRAREHSLLQRNFISLALDRPLQYSLWSHDERLGYTKLGARSDDPAEQRGVFEPEPPFERIEPLLGALQRAMFEFENDTPLPSPEDLAMLSTEDRARLMRAALGGNSVVRRVVESQRAVDAVALHLRDEHDREVPTQFISIHRLPDDLAVVGAEGQATPPARYVIVAQLEAAPTP